mgnify:CR=1 FL=1
METQKPLEREMDPKSGAIRTAGMLELLALVAALVCALAFVYTSLTTTNYIDPKLYEGQHILAKADPILLNLAVTLVVLALFRALRITRLPDWFVRSASIVLLAALALIGVVWSLLMKAVPISDQDVLFTSALSLVKGDPSALQNTTGYEYFYFVRFPYQLGYLSCLETVMRLLGEQGTLIAVPIFNVLLLVSGYGALLLTTQRLFDDNRITFLTLLLLCVCVQPILACTWIYGLIPALSFSLWSVYFAVRFLQNGKKREIPFFVLFAALAVYMKPNAWIVAAAVAITLLLQALKARGWKSLVAAVILLGMCVPLPKIVQATYEDRIGVSFGKGYPMSSWMAMGMRDSWMAAGWYNGYSKEMYYTYGTDLEAISERNRKDIAESVQGFADDPKGAYDFYQEKFASQWNEPTLESIWVSVVCDSYGERGKLAQSIYDGRWPGVVLEEAMGYVQQIVYVGFALSLLILLRKRSVEQLILPIAIVGGVLFHLLFEANSKYALSYLPLFLPYAAYGALAFGVNPRPWFVKDRDGAKKAAEESI